MVIYIDVLIGINIYINYFLLLLTAHILHCPRSRTGICLGAVTGAVGACVMLIDIGTALCVLLKLIFACIMVLTAFGFGSVRQFLCRTMVLLCVTFALAGMMLAVKSLLSSELIRVRNLSVYLDLSPVFLIVSTALCYGVMSVCARLARKKAPQVCFCTVSIEKNGASVTMEGLVDTGNRLTEPFSGLPVIITGKKTSEIICPEGLFSEDIPPGIRLVPFRSVGGSGLMRAFRPDCVTVELCGRKKKTKNAWVAVSEQMDDETQAIVNPDIIG